MQITKVEKLRLNKKMKIAEEAKKTPEKKKK